MTHAKSEVLVTADRIAQAVGRLAAAISAQYEGQPLTLVGVLTGSIVLMADLMRRLTVPHQVEMVRARSYRRDATSPGELRIDMADDLDVAGRHVLLVDDILDTGRTLGALVERMRALGPASVRVAVLLRKRGRQVVPLEPDYCGLEIPNRFVVGYGLDYEGRYRYLPHILAID